MSKQYDVVVVAFDPTPRPLPDDLVCLLVDPGDADRFYVGSSATLELRPRADENTP